MNTPEEIMKEINKIETYKSIREAIKINDIEQVKKLTQDIAEITEQESNQDMLCLSIEKGCPEIFEILLDKYRNPNFDNGLAVRVAIIFEQDSMLDKLLTKGPTFISRTIELAVEQNYVYGTQRLLEHGADLEAFIKHATEYDSQEILFWLNKYKSQKELSEELSKKDKSSDNRSKSKI